MGTPPSANDPTEFRWQAFFQRSTEAVFLLNRQRRFLFVNQAWEKLTGVSAEAARGLSCLRRSPRGGDPWDLIVRVLCCPPAETLKGEPGRVRRLVPRSRGGAAWWDIDFLPLRRDDGLLCILGRIHAIPRDPGDKRPALPDAILALREGARRQYTLERFTSRVPAVQRVVEQIRVASESRAAVLIHGEQGSGKEAVARAIHFAGHGPNRTFAVLDCDRLPPDVLAFSLFNEQGVAHLPQLRTLYLKEPSRMARDVQERLLNLLGEWDGPEAPRIIAGTCRDLAEEVKAGRLLEELRCQLSTLSLGIPSLRERSADMPDLIAEMLQRARQAAPGAGIRLNQPAWDCVRAYTWPDNLQELYAVLLAAHIRAKHEEIGPDDLPVRLRLALSMEPQAKTGKTPPQSLDQVLEAAERRMIQLALRKTQNNRTEAAEVLGIWRQRLTRRMEALGLAEPDKEAGPTG